MPKGYHHLNHDQRCQLYALKQRRINQSQIAFDLGVSQSTVSRELFRNGGKRGVLIQAGIRVCVAKRLGKGWCCDGDDSLTACPR